MVKKMKAIDIANGKWFNGPMSFLPPMSKLQRQHLDGYPESVQSGACDDCGLAFDELEFVWIGDDGVATCPSCEQEIWIQAPEEDPDEWRERQREAKWERMYGEGDE